MTAAREAFAAAEAAWYEAAAGPKTARAAFEAGWAAALEWAAQQVEYHHATYPAAAGCKHDGCVTHSGDLPAADLLRQGGDTGG